MCLIALAYRVHPRYPLVLASNRDEFHARPTAPLGAWPATPPGLSGIYGGRDLQAGGGWLAVTAPGRLAAVTNVRTAHAPAPGLRSRGALLAPFLHGSETAPAHATALHRHASAYGPFNLLLFDGSTLACVSNQPGGIVTTPTAGVHTLSNAALNTPWPKTQRLRTALNDWLNTGSDDPQPLFAALADEQPAPDATLPDTGVGLDIERRLSPVFIRGAHYGTRACSVVLVGAHETVFIEHRFGPDGLLLGSVDSANLARA